MLSCRPGPRRPPQRLRARRHPLVEPADPSPERQDLLPSELESRLHRPCGEPNRRACRETSRLPRSALRVVALAHDPSGCGSQILGGWSARGGARSCTVLLACAVVASALGVVAILAGSAAIAAVGVSSAPSFAPTRDYAGRRPSTFVAIGDLDRDGKVDL